MTLIQKIRAHREWLLQAEICALLHDFGKLSSGFLTYRRSWHLDPRGWDRDPHLRELSEQDPRAPQALIDAFAKTRSFVTPPGEAFSPSGIMRDHVGPNLQGVFAKALWAADGIDARCDRNFPLWSSEQTNRAPGADLNDLPWFRSDVFGREWETTPDRIDQARRHLFSLFSEPGPLAWLQRWPACCPSWAERQSLIDALREHFDSAFADTTRPNNDTSLWEHSWAVASLAKAFMAHVAIGREFVPFETPFSFFGVGWDATRFVGQGQKIPDLAARRALLSAVRRRIRRLVEWWLPIGNTVYEDDSALVLVVPVCLSRNDDYGSLLLELDARIRRLALRTSGGELWVRTAHGAEGSSDRFTTKDTFRVLPVLQEIRRPAAPMRMRGREGLELFTGRPWLNADVCPICRVRPVEGGREEEICRRCLRRRIHEARRYRTRVASPQSEVRGAASTPYSTRGARVIRELADNGGRVALIIARFGLDGWLSGDSVRRLFVSPPAALSRELRQLGWCAAFQNEEEQLKAALQSVDAEAWSSVTAGRAERDITFLSSVMKGQHPQPPRGVRAEDCIFLYGQRAGDTVVRSPDALRDGAMPDPLSVLTKTPTPSTLLDVWETTQEFFSGISQAEGLLSRRLEPRTRLFAPVGEVPAAIREFATYEARIGETRVEFWIEKDRLGDGSARLYLVGPDTNDVPSGRGIQDVVLPNGRTVDLNLVEPFTTEAYTPWREILATPEMSLILVPADALLEVTADICGAAMSHFGRVWSQLPISLGAIAFDERYPMYLVLDAAWRMLDGFARDSAGEAWTIRSVSGQGERVIRFSNGLEWELPSGLGDRAPDPFHGWFRVRAEHLDRPTAFREKDGHWLVHGDDLCEGDEIEVLPSRFAYEYLDSASARFGIGEQPPPAPAVRHYQSASMNIDDIEQAILSLWDLISQSRIGSSSLRAMARILEERQQRWHLGFPITATDGKGQAEWCALARQQVATRFRSLRQDAQDRIFDACVTGTFFEVLALFLHVTGSDDALKEPADDFETTA